MANILIVDDEEMDRLIERTILEGAGHSLYFALDGEAAVKVYRSNPIDLVITDLKMPRLNGLRLIRELRELDPDAAILAVSGASADQLDMAEELGAMHTLVKPLQPNALMKAVTEALDRQRRPDSDAWGPSAQ